MEKKKPSYALDRIKEVLGTERTLSIRVRAFADAVNLGFDRRGVAAVISGLQPGMFVKSMTTFADHRVWQDVYNVPVSGMVLYIKIQADVVAEFTVMSFKEK